MNKGTKKSTQVKQQAKKIETTKKVSEKPAAKKVAPTKKSEENKPKVEQKPKAVAATKPAPKTEKKVAAPAKQPEKKDAKKATKKVQDKKAKKEEKVVKKVKKVIRRKNGRPLNKNDFHAKRLKMLRRRRYVRFVIDCHQQAKDHILKARELEKYLKEHIKVHGKTHNFGKKVRTLVKRNRVYVLSRPPFTKRYLKYLTRRFLKKQTLRDWVRIIANGRKGYKMSYYKIESPEDEEEEVEA
ncbi:putative 60S ribosomal protein L22 [Monocercomonoides exilis]|uniref:putative 60S ribosomal protein L22 n=1 Tax=Monocercomonoides exilis TaxID=2049356 RepID=UPI003559F430|nr:putative 60S ribosomal protein L22 [Monocercomonoides exilis]|eukprot:MONOS_923.1-p1 / transcript=MONOS_923.1 / gene=MONOS_923 / organism=Monocercomonoides_exilis_PA203 / gene_product=60S ribosomal protein L22 / transcript_product=60S ribosomal protein L22 / location=Mono_scaffold00015:150585-151399(-) / protein_length=240 / sequence_SO=supercontig / SO=protein_coding / is_pseudo=false